MSVGLMMKTHMFHKISVLALTTSSLALSAATAFAQNVPSETIGETITNVATFSYAVGDTPQQSAVTNTVEFVVLPPQDTPEIEFFRYSPNASNAITRQLNGTDYSPSGSLAGDFEYIGDAVNTGRIIDTSNPVPLIPAETYLAGELMVLRVDYCTANKSAKEIETLTVTVESNEGDAIVLRLYETSENSCEFWGYMPSTPKASDEYDGVMTTGGNTELTASFQDSENNVEVVVDTALVDPLNFVFDSVSGKPINGATVRLVDVTTGQDASVVGVDGFSSFPSTIVSGQSVEDDSGLVYSADAGVFRFPSLESGEYVVEVTPPEGYDFASILPPELINENTGSGYFIIDGSYGKSYNLDIDGPLRFDIPLDPESEFVVTKTADRSSADVGDFVGYSIKVQNQGSSPAPVRLFDVIPRGFKYLNGTSVIDGETVDDPGVSADGRELTYSFGFISPGQSIRLNYALEIGPGAALGDAVNEALIRSDDGRILSNVARAPIRLREDLFRTRTTIVGRVAENACDGEEDWARDIEDGIGVEGVRLYVETGAYAVSDADGLFHFEGVTTGTHVVQVDEETLPRGFEMMTCEDNTRYAGTDYSKFVDVQGGGVWRANFYLRRTGELFDDVVTEDVFNEATEYKQFDKSWLDAQDNSVDWVYPDTTRTPSKPFVNIGIKHPTGAKIDMQLNGNPVSVLNLMARDASSDRRTMISRWRGVDILDGRNVFIATVKDKNGSVIKTMRKEVHYVTTIARAHGVYEASELVADGRTAPEIAIRLTDESGRPVHAGRVTNIDVEAPYEFFDGTKSVQFEGSDTDLISPNSSRTEIFAGHDGIAKVKLQPTLRTGKVTVNVTLDNGRIVPVYMHLEPEQRDWIIVGLAEGTVGYETVRDKAIGVSPDKEDDVMSDGRIAFFAKGMIKGNWLMTLAVDTDKRRGDVDGDFAQEIDPNAYYTLYGDTTYQEYEAQSRYPLYVKLERREAYGLFGDFNTELNESKLSSYNRRLSGLKAEYLGEKFQVMGFAAETNQGFAKDEIAADGTSGTYTLTNTHILAQSETITIETRDRNRPDVILDRRQMVRYLDYTLDYLTGELIFRLPVDVSDANFNPNVIVVDYETSEEVERNVTFGGRAQTQLADGQVTLGATFIQQNGSAQKSGAKENLIGVDAVAYVNDNTELRLEYSTTENVSDQDEGRKNAILAEVIHTTESLQAEAYYREEDPGFGLSQQGSNTNGLRRYGAEATYKLQEKQDEETGRRVTRSVSGTAYREDNLSTGDSRDTAEVLLTHQGSQLNVSGGLRASRDELASGVDSESLLAVGSASLSLPKHKATIRVSHEQPLNGKDDVTIYPQRTTIGLDKTIRDNIVASVRHEILDGANNSAENTVVGVTANPWNGSTLTASTDLITQDSSRRVGATIGLDQQFQITEKWTASFGARNRKVLDENGEYVNIVGDDVISPLEVNEDFTSGYGGIAYRSEVMSASTRLEFRDSSESETLIGSLAAARELSEELSLAASVRALKNAPKDGSANRETADVRLGAAWRPRNSDETIIFDRLDIGYEDNGQGRRRTKIVNNLAVNTMIDERWQAAFNYGVKHVEEEIAGLSFSSTNHLVGAETRFDVTKKIDLGLRGSILTDGKNHAYSYGPSIGVSPVRNIWVSAGYNVEGYKDEDFEAAEYTREGPYIQLRLKFDQNTASDLLRRISPDAAPVPSATIPAVTQLTEARMDPKTTTLGIVDTLPIKANTDLENYPDFGDNNGLTAGMFFEKLRNRYLTNSKDREYLDFLFKSLGYENGFAEASASMISEDTLPQGTNAILGFGQFHDVAYDEVKADQEASLDAFRIKAADGADVYFMKTCAKHMVVCG